MRLLDAACSLIWAIRPEALHVVLDIADRQEVDSGRIREAMYGAPEAVEARTGRPLDNTRTAQVRDGIAVIPIIGPIFRFSSLFTEVSGATSVDIIARDMATALADPKVTGILLNVNSPGGDADGIAELADMIRAGADRKPMTTYVGHMGASAGYWLASAAPRVVVAETAMLGSIGVVMATRDPRRDKGKEIEFVSSVSPNKRPDPTTPSGQDQYQALVDQLGDIFVTTVARNRGVKPQTVLSDFGAGGLLVGATAVDAGMADAIGSFEGTLAEMQAKAQRAERSAARKLAAKTPAGERITASVGPARGGTSMSMRERFLAWLDGQDGDASGATGAEEIVNEQQQAGTPAPTAQTAVPVTTATTAVTYAAPVPDHAAIRMAELEAENRRLKTSMIHDRATAFAGEQVRAGRAFPAEQDGLTALYAQLAADDEQFGPVQTANGATTRINLFALREAARPSTTTLTSEMLDPAVIQVLQARATTPKAGEGPMSEERHRQLLGASELGQAVVNGRPHTN